MLFPTVPSRMLDEVLAEGDGVCICINVVATVNDASFPRSRNCKTCLCC